jgi:prepilin-type N-terminal cleavage/methylation domain-containing protein
VISDQRGYTMVEMLVVLLILGIVVTGLTTIFVSGSHAELDLNRRFQAQQQARLALDKIRADLHCATAAEVDATYGYLKVAENGNCSSTHVTWCAATSPNMSTRYALYRTTDTTTNRCGASDTSKLIVADYLTRNTGLWSFSAPNGMLELISVDFPISVNPSSSQDVYELKDTIVARNSTRCSATCTQSNYAVSP